MLVNMAVYVVLRYVCVCVWCRVNTHTHNQDLNYVCGHIYQYFIISSLLYCIW